uniref:Uncharacterized protein n=1 Tax=Kalanchoe fedtschenkoi TaxID=63787 RepID=A0A7N0VFM0_KALFE
MARKARSGSSEAKKTTLADLGDDELTYILKFVAESGARNLLVAMTVSKLFMERAKDSTVLRALELHEVEIWGQYLHKYQYLNGLVSLAAQAGNPTAQVKFAMILMLSCSRAVNRNPDYDWSQSATFMTQVSSEMARDGRGVYHYTFLRHFLCQCTPSSLSWGPHIKNYVRYYGKKLWVNDTRIARFREVGYLLRRSGEDWVALKHYLGIETDDYNISADQKIQFVDRYGCNNLTAEQIRELVMEYQRKGPAIDTESVLSVEFAELKKIAIQIFDEAFLSSQSQ